MSDHATIYVFMGPPGSGKGAISALCVQKFGWQQLSTGNLCRWHISQGTDIGKQIDLTIKSGKLISDDLVSHMVLIWLSENTQVDSTVILDGYPRTVGQAQALDTFIERHHGFFVLKIVRFIASDETVAQRMSGRLVCQNPACQAVYSVSQGISHCSVCGSPLGRRKDDAPNAVVERLITYHKHDRALIDYYQTHKQLIYEINAERPLEQVFQEFVKTVGCQ